MHTRRGKCRYADSNVLGALGCRVLDPLSLVGDYGLSRLDVKDAALVLHANHPFQNDGELVEFRTLPWLFPSSRTSHVGHTGIHIPAVDPPNVLVDQFRLGAR